MIKKTIASILLITITLTTCGWFLFMPRKAQAFMGIGDVNLTNIDRIIKDMLDLIWKTIVSSIKETLKSIIIERIEMWGRGEITFEEMFEVDWKEAIADALDEAGGKFLNDFFDTNLCKWTNPQIKIVLQAMATGEGAKKPECTLTDIGDTLENVFDPEKGGGWGKFIVALEPQNNDLGIYVMAQGGTLAEMAAALQEKLIEADVGDGFKAQKECVEWICYLDDTGKHRLRKCTDAELAAGAVEKCHKSEIVTPAASIASVFEFTETIPLKRLAESSDLGEILASFINAMMSRWFREVSQAIRK